MATSERVFTALPDNASTQHAAAPRPGPPVFVQAGFDFCTILAILTVLGAAGQTRGISAATLRLPPLALAFIFVTLLASSGAYPHYRTPLNIARTLGTVRAVACAAALGAIVSLYLHAFSFVAAVPAIALVGALLVVQDELLAAAGKNSPFHGLPRGIIPEMSDLGEPAIRDILYLQRDSSYLLKRAIDIAGSSMLLVLTLPLGIALAALIRLDSEGPVVIRQRRIGRNGEAFQMLKFRSMRVDAPLYARSPTSPCDARLTRFGRSLRRFSLDELPQLWNVVKGEMSLVGPRPEMPFIVQTYTPYERLRLNATPGITGLWQISPARALPIHENLDLDLYYIAHRSFFLDIAIMLRTFTAILRGIGAR